MYEYALEIDEPGVWEVSVYNKESEVMAAIEKAEAELEKAEESMPRTNVEEETNEVCDICGKPMVI